MIACPSCASEAVRKLRVIHEAGTTYYESESDNVGVSIGMSGNPRIYTGIGSSEGVRQSKLAHRFAPPDEPLKPSNGCLWGCGIHVFAVLLGGILYKILTVIAPEKTPGHKVGLGIIIVLYIVALGFIQSRKDGGQKAAYEDALRRYHRAREEWEKSWCCSKCGEVFVVTE